MVFLFLGLKYLPIADAIAISFAAPVFATIFSIIFLKETVRIFRWIRSDYHRTCRSINNFKTRYRFFLFMLFIQYYFSVSA